MTRISELENNFIPQIINIDRMVGLKLPWRNETPRKFRVIYPISHEEIKLPKPIEADSVIAFELERMNRYRKAFGLEHTDLIIEDLKSDQKILLSDVRMAVAASNSLTFTLDEETIKVRSSWENSHHDHFHDRREDKWNWTFVYNSPDNFYGKNRFLIYSSALFNRWHDFMQNEYNRMKSKGIDIDTRLGHQSGAAVLLSLFTEEYAELTGMDDKYTKTASTICNTAALMALCHDHYQTAILLETLSTGSGENPVDLSDSELKESFLAGNLDVARMREKDLVRLHRAISGISAEKGFGLTPFLEDKYAKELAEMEKSEKFLFDGGNISGEEREQLRMVLEYGFAADLTDSISPTDKALWRRYLLEKYKDRIQFDTDTKEIKEGIAGLSNGANYKHIFSLQHDIGRVWAEWFLLGNLIRNSHYLSYNGEKTNAGNIKLQEGKRRINHILKSVIASTVEDFNKTGEGLLRKDPNLITEIKSGLTDELLKKKEERIREIMSKYIYYYKLAANGSRSVYGGEQASAALENKFGQLLRGISQEEGNIRRHLKGKKLRHEGTVTQLKPDNADLIINRFRELNNYVAEKLFNQLGIERKTFKNKFWMPYGSYYSLGDISQMTTISNL